MRTDSTVRHLHVGLGTSFALAFSLVAVLPASARPQDTSAASPAPQAADHVDQQAASVSPERTLLNRYCVGCHNPRLKSGNLVLDTIDVSKVAGDPETWERVVRKLRGGL